MADTTYETLKRELKELNDEAMFRIANGLMLPSIETDMQRERERLIAAMKELDHARN